MRLWNINITKEGDRQCMHQTSSSIGFLRNQIDDGCDSPREVYLGQTDCPDAQVVRWSEA